MTEQRKAVIKNADMSEDMQQDAVDIASQALAKYNIEKVSPLFVIGERRIRLAQRFKGWLSISLDGTIKQQPNRIISW